MVLPFLWLQVLACPKGPSHFLLQQFLSEFSVELMGNVSLLWLQISSFSSDPEHSPSSSLQQDETLILVFFMVKGVGGREWGHSQGMIWNLGQLFLKHQDFTLIHTLNWIRLLHMAQSTASFWLNVVLLLQWKLWVFHYTVNVSLNSPSKRQISLEDWRSSLE